MDGKTFLSALFGGTVEGITRNVFDGLIGHLGKQGEDFLKAHTSGRSVNDEVLSMDAAATAVVHFGMPIDQVVLVDKVLNDLTADEKKRANIIIGFREQEITINIPNTDGNNQLVYDKKGNLTYKKTTVLANVKGAMTYLVLGKMTEAQIKDHLAAHGCLDTPSKQRAETMKNIKEFMDRPDVKPVVNHLKTSLGSLKADLEADMAKPTIFARWADRLKPSKNQP